MYRRFALALAWGLALWNAIALLAYASGLAFGAYAAPVGLLGGAAVWAIASRTNAHRGRTARLKFGADRA